MMPVACNSKERGGGVWGGEERGEEWGGGVGGVWGWEECGGGRSVGGVECGGWGVECGEETDQHDKGSE